MIRELYLMDRALFVRNLESNRGEAAPETSGKEIREEAKEEEAIMSLRRFVGFLLSRRFLPRATPRTAPERSLHYTRDLPIRDAAGVAAVVFAGVGTLALQYFRKDPADDESAARKKDEDMKAMFEDWAKNYNRTYRDEEEKAMRFKVFKDKLRWAESQPPPTRDILLPLNCFADIKFEEFHRQSCIVEIDDPETQEYNKKLDEFFARKDRVEGEVFVWIPVKQGDKQATQVSA